MISILIGFVVAAMVIAVIFAIARVFARVTGVDEDWALLAVTVGPVFLGIMALVLFLIGEAIRANLK